MPGRKPKPTKLKILDGEPNKNRINPDEPQPKSEIPSCPAHLSTPAKTEWKRIVVELGPLGLLTKIDRAELAAYCDAYGQWVLAKRKLNELASMSPDKLAFLYKTTNGNLIINPLLSVANKAREDMHKFLVEFGMTPASRSRISASPSLDGQDDLDRLLNTSTRNN